MFITFEGTDGAGKSTVSVEVSRILQIDGYKVLHLDKKNIVQKHPHLARHSEAIKDLIWGYPPTAPIGELGDGHWLHLMACWFHMFDDTVVRPALATSDVVLVDSWIGKFLARFVLKSTEWERQARSAFAGLSQPDLTVLLDVDPAIAAGRKREFTIAECGNLDGMIGASRENFITYQNQVRAVLGDFAQEWNWRRVDSSNRSQVQVTGAVLELIAPFLCPVAADRVSDQLNC